MSEQSESVFHESENVPPEPPSEDSSSSDSSEEGISSPPPNKRSRRSHRSSSPVERRDDPRIESLIAQVSFLTQYMGSLQPQMCHTQTTSNYLNNPSATQTPSLSLGELNTDFDNNKLTPQADKERLATLNRLQQFESPAWKGIRYKKTLQAFMATPGFTPLKVNDELCHLNTSKDYLASTEQVLAGLSNAVLEHRQMLQFGLQTIIDWASKSPEELNPNSLFDKISRTFGPETPIYKNSEQTMQIICGKRSECIEIRRDLVLKQVTNTNLKATLRNVPPSAEFLFSKDALLPIIQSLGGSQVWLNTPNYLKKPAPTSSIPSTSYQNRAIPNKKYQNSKFNKSQKKSKYNVNVKKNQPFRGGSGNNQDAQK
ncbi:hypothetical protein ABMA28_014698 [Loxostege sticticalis]|uniref:Uncharacterized protein n=1 Tax=Loxostege sticticalis TaxID=481309 RepID=A0ABD0TBY1_LOXSC